jgi:PhnB protein
MSTPRIQPYLFFNGRCEEALEFYHHTLGAEVILLLRFKEAPDAPPGDMMPPDWEEKVMHSSFRIGESILMAADGRGETRSFQGISLTLTLPDADEARRVFIALSEGGSVEMPLGETFWSPCYGMLTDRFGLGWIVRIPEPG